MKKLILFFAIASVVIISCNDHKEDQAAPSTDQPAATDAPAVTSDQPPAQN